MTGKWVRTAWLFLPLFLLSFCLKTGSVASADAENGTESSFHLFLPEQISGYQNNPLTVQAPEDGVLTIRIEDETALYREIIKEIESGKTQVIWDGLGWNEERMAAKDYRISAMLVAPSGKVYASETGFTMLPAQQAVLFALPSDSEVYLGDTDDWFLEFKLLYTDEMKAEFFRTDTGELVFEHSRQVKGGRVNSISFAALTGGKRTAPAAYRIRISGKRHPANAKEFSLTIREGLRPELPLQVTGEIMPSRDDSDQEIWEKMIAPATVIDIRNTSHQKVFEQPNPESRVLGTLHGQSQSLSVLEIKNEWAYIHAWNHESGEPVWGWVPSKKLKVVQPQTQYGLLLDKKHQTLTVYENGKKIDTLLVSTGRMEKGKLYQETAAGSFLTDEHMSDYSTNGLKYDFVIRYDGGNLLHQIPYAWNERGKKDMIPGELFLGSKASHACIRIQEKPSPAGINAYWFWTHLPYHTRVIVLDDPVERENLLKLVTGSTPELEAEMERVWQVDSEDESRITITFGGDVVLGGRESYFPLEEGFPKTLEREGPDYPFSGLSSVFQADDLTVVNLECVLKEDSAGEDLTKKWRFRGLPEYVQVLQKGGIDLVNLANNHTIDYGESGYRSTMSALAGHIPFSGNGNNLVLELRGCLFGFGGCRETTYKADPGIIERDISELRKIGAEFIIYQCHWGTEYEENHNSLQEAMARNCYRAGADLVIGHHPHVVQGIDWIEDMPVIYSLGNLMFGGTIQLSTFDGFLVQARFYPERETERIDLHLIPVLTSSSAEKRENDYRPAEAKGEDAFRILQKIQKDTPWSLAERVSLNYR